VSSQADPPVWEIAEPIADGDAPRLCERLRRLLLERGDGCVVVCDVAALGADIGTVDALARLQLTARHLGCRIRLERASPELERLLAFVGLGLVLGRGLGLGVGLGVGLGLGAEAEEREQPGGVEERVDRGDAAV
jgi:hypothetical protein